MRIRPNCLTQVLRPVILTPDLRISQKESLLGRIAVQLLFRYAPVLQAAQQRHVREANAGIVRAVLTKRQTPVDVRALNRTELRILVCNAVGSLLKLLFVLRRPPVAK